MERLRPFLPIVEAVALELVVIASVFCVAMWIYSFIVVRWPKIRDEHRRKTQISTENAILKEMGKTREGIVEESYRKANLDAVLEATQQDLTSYLSEVYDEQIGTNDVHIDKIVKKTWTDTTLNCPKEDESGEPSPPPTLEESQGWLLVWKFRESPTKLRRFQYHTTVHGEWVRCGEIDVPEGVQQSYKTTDN